MTEPLACVVQGLNDCAPKPGQHALVIGSGPIGLMFTRLLKHAGCRVTVAGRGQPRLKAARHLGADEVVEVGDTGSMIEDLRGTRFDLVVEAVGKPETWEAAVQLVRKGGVVNFFGGCPSATSVQFDTDRLHYSNITLLGSFHHTPRTIRGALELIESGIIRAADFVDGECPLTKLPELFRSMAAGNRAVKTLVRVHEPLSVIDLLDWGSRTHSWTIPAALERIARGERGVLVLLHRSESAQELRRRAIAEQPRTETKMDLRNYGIGAQILRDLGVGRMRVLARPRKMPSMAGFDLEVTGYEQIPPGSRSSRA